MKVVVKVVLPLVLLVCCGKALAAEPQFPAYVGHVNDFANVIDEATKQNLETILTNFESRTGAQLALVTITTLGERPIEEYANALYRAWGVGAKSGDNKNKGALLLVATGDRRSRLEVGYGLEGDLPDGLAGEMLRRMRPFFREQRWSEGVTLGINTLVATLAQKWNVSIEGIDQQLAYEAPAEQEQASPLGFILAIVFLVILFIIIARIARRGGGGPGGASWVGPLIFNRGGGGFGGGSWGSIGGDWGGGSGGGGGGGGWGGFGGGSSGGGGASDSW